MANEPKNKAANESIAMRLYFLISRLDSVSLLIDYADKDDKFSKAVSILNESSSSLKEITEELQQK